jgi:hypothetical protein
VLGFCENSIALFFWEIISALGSLNDEQQCLFLFFFSFSLTFIETPAFLNQMKNQKQFISQLNNLQIRHSSNTEDSINHVVSSLSSRLYKDAFS